MNGIMGTKRVTGEDRKSGSMGTKRVIVAVTLRGRSEWDHEDKEGDR